jgi:hypothetical protein
MSENQVPAGWYPDPAGDTSKIRYWNGSAWADEFMDAATSAGQAAVPGIDAAIGVTGGNASGEPLTYTPSPTVSTADTSGYPGTYPAGPAPYGQAPTYQQSPYATGQGPDRKGFAIAGLVLGIVSVCACVCSYFAAVPALLAIIFSALGLKSSKKGVAIAGLIVGVIGLILAIVMTFVGLDIYNNPERYGLPADYYENLFGVFLLLP